MSSVQPFQAILHPSSGEITPRGPVTERRASDLSGLVQPENAGALEALIENGNPVVYRVVGVPIPEEAGQVPFSITTIEPGMIGNEFYFTKGHWHTAEEGEVYYGLEGQGVLLVYNGEVARAIDLVPGAVGYIPHGWAHRTVNTGDTPFRFLAVYPGLAGHDYQRILDEGIGASVVRGSDGKYALKATTGRVEPLRSGA